KEKAGKVTEQLFLFNTLLSVGIMVLLLACQQFILTVVFGSITPEVMSDASIYLRITAYSIPFIAIYNTGAAVYRAMSNSKVPMQISFLMNFINVAGNAIMIYGMESGVEGAAIPTLISRVVAAIVVTTLLFNPKLDVHMKKDSSWKLDFQIIHKICIIGIPNGLENSLFQLGKILVLSMVAGFGTIAIAANAVSNNIALFQILPGVSINFAMLTVVSHCMGSRAIEEAKYYTKLLMKYAYIGMILCSGVVILCLPLILNIYHLSPETASITKNILIYHGICCMFIWAPSFTLPNALRAAGDAVYPMVISMISMWMCRILFSYILGVTLEMGVFGIWVAMTIDWAVRSVFLVIRYQRGKWQKIVL
ncbi:MAG: MATE family efflux transporter, partial [Eubacteriales bacterium]